jgi:hypothetical protein
MKEPESGGDHPGDDKSGDLHPTAFPTASIIG